LHLGGLTGKRRTAAAVGSDVDDGGATVIFRGGEVDDGVRLLAAVTMACSVSSPSSRNSSHGWMETKISGDTPARNYWRTGGLHRRKKGYGNVILRGEYCRIKIRSRGGLFWWRPGAQSSNNDGDGEIRIGLGS
jgi:hypothetical protein